MIRKQNQKKIDKKVLLHANARSANSLENKMTQLNSLISLTFLRLMKNFKSLKRILAIKEEETLYKTWKEILMNKILQLMKS